MGIFSSLDRSQKESIGLLQIGTVLEYFDLMLYIHMAVLLNDLFFPKSDPHTASILTAFAFCSTYVFRPIGALIFGFIGDHIGRRQTVIITSAMMAISCAIMGSMPTYAQVGIIASYGVTICRALQGLSSLGEIIGADIYLTETIKPPMRYVVVSLIDAASFFGVVLALFVANLAINFNFNWRIAFFIGTVIALIGFMARARLRETPEFADMQKRVKHLMEESHQAGTKKIAELLMRKKTNDALAEKTDTKNILATFFMFSSWPVFMYFTYIYCGNLLKHSFHCTSGQVIQQNFIVSIVAFLSILLFGLLSYKFHPIKLLKIKLFIFISVVFTIPGLLHIIKTPNELLVLQSFCVFFAVTDCPATAILINHFPVFKRFTYVSMLDAISRIVIYVITSFGLVYLTEYYGFWGLWIIMLPVLAGFYWGLLHFERLEAGILPLFEKKTLSQHLKAQGLR